MTGAPRRARQEPHGRWAAARRPCLAALAALCATAILALPESAAAHAVLTHTHPDESASVNEAPDEVEFEFNEPVEATFGAIRVFDERGEAVPTGPLTRPGGEAEKVAVPIEAELDKGVYTATYRVVSADGHPVTGGFSFGVQAPVRTTGRTAPNVADLLEQAGPGAAVEVTYGAVRAIQYAALLLVIGAVFFTVLVWLLTPGPAWPRRLLLGVAIVGTVASALGVPLQGALAAGVGLGDAFNSAVIDGALSTDTGRSWAIRAGLWLALVVVLAIGSGFNRARLAAAAALALAIVTTLIVAGHAWSQSPQLLLVPADFTHMVAAGAWLGGLVLLLALYWPRGGRDHAVTARATARFSRLALPAVLALVAAGVLQSWFHLDSTPSELVTSDYGLLVLAKIGLIAAIVALAAGNRRRVERLIDAGAQTRSKLRRSMLAEVGFAVVVLGVTAGLVRLAPPASLANGPQTRELDLENIRLELVIEPATTGPNDYHLYFFDRTTGAQIKRVKGVTLRLEQPERGVGPITLDVPYKNAAHYELLGPALGVPGTWEVAVDVRISKFEELTAETEIEVRTP